MSYFEDMPIGGEMDLGEHLFTKEEIMEFAKNTIPLPNLWKGAWRLAGWLSALGCAS